MDGENRRKDRGPTGSGILELVFREWKQQSIRHRPDSARSPPPIVHQPEGFQPKGFGGWLIFPAFQTLISPPYSAWGAFHFLQLTREPSFVFSSYKGLILYSLLFPRFLLLVGVLS
jgi:hypothetical protein